MDRLLWQYRFRDTWNRVRIGNRKFRFRADDWSAIALRGNIASQRPNAREVTWLLPFRRVLRKIIRFEPRIALALIIDSTDDEFLRRLAIRLRGKCHGSMGAAIVSRFSTSGDRALRLEVARCLNRLGAWSQLRLIASADSDPQVRRIATQPPPKPYTDRLASFAGHVAAIENSDEQRDLVVSAGLVSGPGRRPQSRSLIRQLLERIHQMVVKSNNRRAKSSGH